MFVQIARSSCLVVVLGSFLMPSALSAQNLVPNPNFTSGVLINWTAEEGCTNDALCSVQPDNANFFPTTAGNAPSARLASSEVDSPGQLLRGDCTALSAGIVPGSTVDLGAYRRMNSGTVNSVGRVDFVFTSGGFCLNGGGVFQGQAVITDLGETSPGSGWFLFGQQGFVIPALTTHFEAILTVHQPTAAGTADFSFDHVFLGPVGTTPVELQSFSVD